LQEIAPSNFDSKNNLKPKKGSNKFVWDTKYEGAEILDGMIFWSASFSGAKASPGKYKVELTKNRVKKSKTFDILINPNSEAEVKGIQMQVSFVNSINKLVDKAHKAIKKIRKINKILIEFEENYEGSNQLISQSKKLRNQLLKIEKTLYQTQNQSSQDPLNFPIKLTNKLGHLNSLVTYDDFPPTNQDEEVRDELTNKVDEQLKKFNNLIDHDLKKFNNEFTELKLDYLKID